MASPHRFRQALPSRLPLAHGAPCCNAPDVLADGAVYFLCGSNWPGMVGMRLAVLKERQAAESRVAATPETVRKLIDLGLTVAVESGAGAAASIADAEFAAAGAEIAPSAEAALAGAGIVFAVQTPDADLREKIPRGALLVCIANAFADPSLVPSLAQAGIDAVAMELLPRITRAQAMDVLSSQANLAGYRAVIEAAYAFPRGFPMMMTAAGTVPPARVFVIGAGVAGLQAIATARRLGAIVSATDVRPAAKEEIRSLGASFVGVEDEETKAQTGAYAKEMSEAFRRKQAELMEATVAKNDIVDLHRAGDGPQGAGDRHPEDGRRDEIRQRHRRPRVRRRRQLRRDRAGRAHRDGERRYRPRLPELAFADRRRVQLALRPQPPDIPFDVLGQGRQGAETAAGRRDRRRGDAEPRWRRRAPAIPALPRRLSTGEPR